MGAVLAANGLHLPIIQGFAWVKMFEAYSTIMPASEALKITFTGEAMCGTCDWVAEQSPVGQSDGKHWDVFLKAPLLILMLMATVMIIAPEARRVTHFFEGLLARQLPSSAPLLPP